MKQHLKAFIIVLVLAGLAVWGFNHQFGDKTYRDAQAHATLESMEKEGVANFKMKDLDGKEFDLESFKGKILVLNFWASWCAPCIEEVPSLIKLVREFKGDIQLVAISGDSSREDIEIFLKSFPELKDAHIKVVYDEDRSLMQKFSVSRLPESLILDPQQKLAKKLVGSIDWYTPDSVKYLKSLLPATK